MMMMMELAKRLVAKQEKKRTRFIPTILFQLQPVMDHIQPVTFDLLKINLTSYLVNNARKRLEVT